MAFFKIRWPGQQAAETKSAKVARAVRGETVEVMRRRARHRLMGAALLVFVGVVGFPLVFDTQPRPIPVDTRIEIPDRDKLAPLVVPEQAAAGAVAGSEAPPAPAARVAESAVQPAPPLVAEQAATPAPTHKDAASPAFVEAKPQAAPAKADAPVVAAAPAAAARPSEAERARALLEGRTLAAAAPAAAAKVAAAPAPAAAAPAGGERFIVQVGAFSDEAKVREARQKLERAGLTTYTQAVDTKDGKRTRVRVGPFQGREQADNAAAKIKALGLPAAVLTL